MTFSNPPRFAARLYTGVLRRLRRQTVRHGSAVLPAPHLRPGGEHFQDDEAFVASGINEAERLIDAAGIDQSSTIVDVGCGVGRLAIGLLNRVGEMSNYHGLDVNNGMIDWCNRFIAQDHPGCRFVLMDARNSRYNAGGAAINDSIALPVASRSVDVVYLYSVFSHMVSSDVRPYLADFARVLAPDGRVFLTAFLEDDVPDMSINPPNYRRAWLGPLHCVRFNREFFGEMVGSAGLRIDRIDYEVETDGQCGVYLSLGE